MREILFRAKRLDNGEWAESASIALHYLEESGEPVWFIGARQPANQWNDQHGNMMAVKTKGNALFYACDPDTVGQYTGLTDKNGTKIFEGDIVDILNENEETGVIEWAPGEAMFVISSDGWCASFDNYWGKDVEVIGNIHDNPELLEENDHA